MATESSVAYTTMIRDLPRGERPRERLRDQGAAYLSNAELIAILLRTGVAGENVLNLSVRLLSKFQGLPGLARATFSELTSIRGISEAKACQLMAAFELGRRLVSLHPEDRAVIRCPEDVANLFAAEMSLLDQEHLRVVLLDTKNHVTGVSEVYIGNVNSSVVRPAEVLRPAVRDNAVAVIVVHESSFRGPGAQPGRYLHYRAAQGFRGDAWDRGAGPYHTGGAAARKPEGAGPGLLRLLWAFFT